MKGTGFQVAVFCSLGPSSLGSSTVKFWVKHMQNKEMCEIWFLLLRILLLLGSQGPAVSIIQGGV